MSPRRRLEGVAWMLMGSAFLSIMSALTRFAREDVGTSEVIFVRAVVVALVSGALLRAQGHALWPGAPRLLALRSLMGLTAMYAYFWALGEIPLGMATTLLQTSPLFIALLSGRLLGESASRGMWLWTAAAFVGVALIVRPTQGLEWGAVMALVAGLTSALAYLAVRGLRQSDPPARIVFWFAVLSALVSAPLSLEALVQTPRAPSLWAAMVGVGVFGALGQLSSTQAYRLEKANVVGPFAYATVAISYLLGLVFWGEFLSGWGTLGIALVVASGVMLSRAADAQEPKKEPDQPAEP